MATSEIQNLIQSQAQRDFLENNYQTSDHKILLETKPEIDDINTKSDISIKEHISLLSLQTKQKLVDNLIILKDYDRPNAFAFMHQIECFVDFVQRHCISYKFIYFNIAFHIHLNIFW